MQITSPQKSVSQYGLNQPPPPAPSAKAAQPLNVDKAEKVVTVAISPEAQALQQEAAAKKAEETTRRDAERANQQQQQTQQLQTQASAGRSGRRIDITV